jgi:HEPN domain-containing protein
MNTRLIALDYIKRARTCMNESKGAFKDGDYNRTIRKSHRCVQLSLHAVLRSFSIILPHKQDVDDAISTIKKNIPDWFARKMPEFIEISHDIKKSKGLEASQNPCVIGKKDAEEFLIKVEDVFGSCKKLVNEMFIQ